MRRTLELDVPAGVDDNIVLSKRGQGEPGANGGPNGDLLIQITVKPHKLFRREGTNLRLEVPISFTQAALGAEIDVPTLDGSVKYTIPEGTQTDTEFRIRGKGIQQLGSNNKGDLIFKVRVETPAPPDRKAARAAPPVRRRRQRQAVRPEKDLHRQGEGTVR